MTDLLALDIASTPAPRVLNAKSVGKQTTADRVYVGRPGKWGNPFFIGRDGTRDEVIAKYRAWIVTQSTRMAALAELRGKDLICWCAPLPCHADVLLDLANREAPGGIPTQEVS